MAKRLRVRNGNAALLFGAGLGLGEDLALESREFSIKHLVNSGAFSEDELIIMWSDMFGVDVYVNPSGSRVRVSTY